MRYALIVTVVLPLRVPAAVATPASTPAKHHAVGCAFYGQTQNLEPHQLHTAHDA